MADSLEIKQRTHDSNALRTAAATLLARFEQEEGRVPECG